MADLPIFPISGTIAPGGFDRQRLAVRLLQKEYAQTFPHTLNCIWLNNQPRHLDWDSFMWPLALSTLIKNLGCVKQLLVM